MGVQTRFHKLLEEMVRERLESVSISIIGGQCPDYPSYREQIGYIRGLTDALRLCEDIDRGLDS